MVSPTLNTASAATAAPTSALASDQLNMQDFLSLLTTQLENQDPMDPMSDSDFFAQMAQLGQVEGMDQLNSSSQVQQAQALMGKTVTAANPNAGAGQTPTVSGVVQSLSVQSGVYYLGIQQANGSTVSVPLSSLQSVTSTPNLANAADLVGQTVTGTTVLNGQSVSVMGTVTGVSAVNGVPTLTVQPKGGSAVQIPVGQLTSIS